MTTIRKVMRLEHDAYYQKHLEIINPVLPIRLTPKEIEITASFMAMTGEISQDRFGTTARKILMKKLSLSHGGLGNHMKSLKTKGVIVNGSIAPILFPSDQTQDYSFKLINIG